MNLTSFVSREDNSCFLQPKLSPILFYVLLLASGQFSYSLDIIKVKERGQPLYVGGFAGGRGCRGRIAGSSKEERERVDGKERGNGVRTWLFYGRDNEHDFIFFN